METKICHVSTLTNLGGVEKILIDFLHNRNFSKFSHFLMTTSSDPQILKFIVNFHNLTFQPIRKYKYDPNTIIQMVNWLKLQNFQIVHSYNSKGVSWGGLSAVLAKIPIFIASEHGTVWNTKSLDFLLNIIMFHKASGILANSLATKKLICYRYRIDPRKVHVLYNLIPEFNLKNMNLLRLELNLRQELIIGSVGRLVPQKGYDILLKAAKEICKSNKNVVFVIIGGGPNYKNLKKEISKLNLEKRFFLLGWRYNVRELIQEFDIFISTSLSESFGNVLIEAALAEVPTISPNIDGIPEAVIDKETGLLIEPTVYLDKNEKKGGPLYSIVNSKISVPKKIDYKILIEKINYLLNNPVLRKKIGKSGRERAIKLFSLSQYISNLDNYYDSLIQNK